MVHRWVHRNGLTCRRVGLQGERVSLLLPQTRAGTVRSATPVSIHGDRYVDRARRRRGPARGRQGGRRRLPGIPRAGRAGERALHHGRDGAGGARGRLARQRTPHRRGRALGWSYSRRTAFAPRAGVRPFTDIPKERRSPRQQCQRGLIVELQRRSDRRDSRPYLSTTTLRVTAAPDAVRRTK